MVDVVERFFIASQHKGEIAFFGGPRTFPNRRVDHADSALREHRADLAHGVGPAG